MAGTKIGGKKAAYTNRLLHGVDFYARIGAKGGRNGHTGGFASMPRERVSEIGRRGGTRSSRRGIKNGEGRKVRYEDERVNYRAY